MKVFAISDWHLSINNPKPMDIFGAVWDNYIEDLSQNLNAILDDDTILLIAGDISWAMLLDQAKPDLDFISKFKGTKVIMRGNHDYWWKSISGVRALAGSGTLAVQNDSVKIGNIIIAGSRGWTIPTADDYANQKIYDREVLRIKMSLDDAAKKRQEGDKLIVMTHYPPFIAGKNSAVTDAITAAKADAVVYGHIHGTNYKGPTKTIIDDIPYYLTSCDILKNVPIKVL